jgi:hypothetical protein
LKYYKTNIPKLLLLLLLLLLRIITEIYSANKIKVQINGFRQGCNLLPTLFNIYMNEIIENGNIFYITLLTSTKRNTSVFEDDHVIIADSVDNLLRGVFTLKT